MAELEVAIGLAVLAAIALPHVLPLDGAPPRVAALIWFDALVLRALVCVAAAILLVLYLPQTSLYATVAAACWHELAPVAADDLGLSGHKLADAAIVLPALALAGSLLWVGAGLARAAVGVHAYVSRHARGIGPRGSTLVADSEILVAVTGLARPRIVVSVGALVALDEDELAASLAHERGHIRHRHRPVLVAGSLCAALGRLLPGTRGAERELAFWLERDADNYASRYCDRLALASALCKAAGAPGPAGALALGGAGSVARRVEYLLELAPSSRCGTGAYRALAVAMTALAIGLVVTLPVWATASPPAHPSAPASCAH